MIYKPKNILINGSIKSEYGWYYFNNLPKEYNLYNKSCKEKFKLSLFYTKIDENKSFNQKNIKISDIIYLIKFTWIKSNLDYYMVCKTTDELFVQKDLGFVYDNNCLFMPQILLHDITNNLKPCHMTSKFSYISDYFPNSFFL
ncbi:MAG TPA: hypothetical protein VKN74_02815 [Candidatus Mcinerneyibacterium sp.]|nr:hypothetical protein [Candidatus Mcinerneyibacterium sp.]